MTLIQWPGLVETDYVLGLLSWRWRNGKWRGLSGLMTVAGLVVGDGES